MVPIDTKIDIYMAVSEVKKHSLDIDNILWEEES